MEQDNQCLARCGAIYTYTVLAKFHSLKTKALNQIKYR